MADEARPVWVDDQVFPFDSRFVIIALRTFAHGDVQRKTPRES